MLETLEYTLSSVFVIAIVKKDMKKILGGF